METSRDSVTHSIPIHENKPVSVPIKENPIVEETKTSIIADKPKSSVIEEKTKTSIVEKPESFCSCDRCINIQSQWQMLVDTRQTIFLGIKRIDYYALCLSPCSYCGIPVRKSKPHCSNGVLALMENVSLIGNGTAAASILTELGDTLLPEFHVVVRIDSNPYLGISFGNIVPCCISCLQIRSTGSSYLQRLKELVAIHESNPSRILQLSKELHAAANARLMRTGDDALRS